MNLMAPDLQRSSCHRLLAEPRTKREEHRRQWVACFEKAVHNLELVHVVMRFIQTSRFELTERIKCAAYDSTAAGGIQAVGKPLGVRIREVEDTRSRFRQGRSLSTNYN